VSSLLEKAQTNPKIVFGNQTKCKRALNRKLNHITGCQTAKGPMPNPAGKQIVGFPGLMFGLRLTVDCLIYGHARIRKAHCNSQHVNMLLNTRWWIGMGAEIFTARFGLEIPTFMAIRF